MRKFLLLSAALLIAVLFAFSSVGVAETSNLNEDYKVSKAYSITQEICEKFPNRRAGINAQTPRKQRTGVFEKPIDRIRYSYRI